MIVGEICFGVWMHYLVVRDCAWSLRTSYCGQRCIGDVRS